MRLQDVFREGSFLGSPVRKDSGRQYSSLAWLVGWDDDDSQAIQVAQFALGALRRACNTAPAPIKP